MEKANADDTVATVGHLVTSRLFKNSREKNVSAKEFAVLKTDGIVRERTRTRTSCREPCGLRSFPHGIPDSGFSARAGADVGLDKSRRYKRERSPQSLLNAVQTSSASSTRVPQGSRWSSDNPTASCGLNVSTERVDRLDNVWYINDTGEITRRTLHADRPPPVGVENAKTVRRTNVVLHETSTNHV